VTTHPDHDATARRVIDANHYMTLGTVEPDGSPRLSPVYFTAARYTDFYWLSSPLAHHSRNVVARPGVRIVIFDSTARVGAGAAVYISAVARQVADDEVEGLLPEAFSPRAGARAFAADELRGDAGLRLFVASASAWDVHVPGRDPVHGSGIDRREPADPRSGV
jgi:hypothetical protein